MTAYLVFEAVHRFMNPTEHEVVGKIMFIIACCGLVFNVIQISILHSGDLEGMHGHSHNCGGHGHSHSHGNAQEEQDDGDEEHGHGHSHSHAHSHGDNHKEDANIITVEEKYPRIILNESTMTDEEKRASFANLDVSKDENPLTETVVTSAGVGALASVSKLKDPGYNSPTENSMLIDNQPAVAVPENSKKVNKEKEQPKRNINVQAAYLHVLGDLLNSLGVVVASGLIYAWP